MKSPPESRMKFPCDCISCTPACEEPWARVAKEGMFKDGTKEEILNKIHRQPHTIAQLAKAMKLAQPTVFRHVSELLANGLVREFTPDRRDYVVERYYAPGFPVVTLRDQRRYKEEIGTLAAEMSAALQKRLSRMKTRFQESDASRAGLSFEEFAHFLVHRAQRDARRLLERNGDLARKPADKKPGFIFWGIE